MSDAMRPLTAWIHPTTDGSGHWISLEGAPEIPNGRRVEIQPWRGMHDDESMRAARLILNSWGYELAGVDASASISKTVFLITKR